jgi:DNA polymerase
MPISSKKSLNKLNEEVISCKQCLDLVKTRIQPVCGTGAPNSKLIIVGYYPSDHGAEKSGIPFTNDEEGKLIRKLIAETGLSLEEDTYLTYLVKCNPRKVVRNDTKMEVKTFNPSAKHIQNCINYLTEEISIITPHIIISLGLYVTNILLKNFFSVEKKHNNMSKLHMRLFENPSFKLLPFYGLDDVKRGLILEEKYTTDFKSLSKLIAII